MYIYTDGWRVCTRPIFLRKLPRLVIISVSSFPFFVSPGQKKEADHNVTRSEYSAGVSEAGDRYNVAPFRCATLLHQNVRAKHCESSFIRQPSWSLHQVEVHGFYLPRTYRLLYSYTLVYDQG